MIKHRQIFCPFPRTSVEYLLADSAWGSWLPGIHVLWVLEDTRLIGYNAEMTTATTTMTITARTGPGEDARRPPSTELAVLAPCGQEPLL